MVDLVVLGSGSSSASDLVSGEADVKFDGVNWVPVYLYHVVHVAGLPDFRRVYMLEVVKNNCVISFSFRTLTISVAYDLFSGAFVGDVVIL